MSGAGLPRRRFLALSACALAAPAMPAAGGAPQIWRGTAMGADVVLRVEGAPPRQARAFFAEAARRLTEVEDNFSLHRGSALTRLNALGRLDRPSAQMIALLGLARRIHDATGGAFDPSVQPLWLAARDGRAPDPAMLGLDEVDISRAVIRLPRPGMALTLNGIAQGWAADRLDEAAAAHDLGNILIDTGEIIGRGGPWQAGIAMPDGRIVQRVTLQGRALATSSPIGTRIGPNGDQPHILDPRGGAPHWALASVSATTAAEADALSTAACVMDRGAIIRAVDAIPGARLEALES